LPSVADVTAAVTVQVPPLGGIVPPLSVIVLPPDVAEAVPPQVVATLLGDATMSPPGRLSVNAVPVAAAVPVLPSVTVTVDVPLTVIDEGENVLLTVTAASDAGATTRKAPNANAPSQRRVISLEERFELCGPRCSAATAENELAHGSHALPVPRIPFPLDLAGRSDPKRCQEHRSAVVWT
jgi:hypothetical protein